MSYISSFHSSPHPKDSTTHDRSSPGLSKSNFKKFTLLHQHDNPSKKAENNLQKTLSLIHSRSPEAHRPADYSYRRGSISKIEHMDSVYSPKRASESKALIDRNRENTSLRNDIEDLKYENYLLKVNHSPARLKRSYIEESKPENIAADNESLRHQVRELMKENEGLRYEVTHVKAEYQRRYEDVKKSNDSLLLSYEERHRQSLQSVKESYENEINDLKGEIGRMQAEINRNEEMFKHQKDKLLTSNMRLEKEKQDLFLKVNQISLANAIGTRSPGYSNDSFTAKETSNQFMDQVLKEKHELLGQYNDLFSSYNIMLEHNRVLTEKLENVEKERDELLKLHDLPPSTARRHHDKKKKAQVYEESPGKSKRSKDSHRSLTVKTSKETSKKASVQAMNSTLNQRTREMLMEELKDDLNNFEDKLKASTGSLDGILNPKLASSGNKVPQLSQSGTLRNSGILKENAYGLINNSKGQQPRSSSTAKSSRSKDKKGNTSALIENDKEQNIPQSSMRSSIKHMTQKNSNSSRGSPKASKKLSLSTTQSRHSISELSTRNNSTKGGKVPLYSKVKKI